MTTAETTVTVSGRSVRHRCLSLIALVERICRCDDEAVHEFHQYRPIFRHKDGQPLLLVEYLEKLREDHRAWEWCGRDAVALDRAVDLALDKFSNLPRESALRTRSRRKNRPRVKQNGPDCRYYFQAFLDHMAKKMSSPKRTSQLEQDVLAARSLQTLVCRHYWWSCLECARRGNPRVRRYRWSVDGRGLSIWMPKSMTGSDCQAWLADNVEDPAPDRPGERERVQALVDDRLGPQAVVPYDEDDYATSITDSLCAWSTSHDVSVHGLATAVAEEKAANIERQRDAVRDLGKRKLKRMVLAVFEGLAGNGDKDGAIAREFGLNKSTFSRFASSRWSELPGRVIPDLWSNTAMTVAANPRFVEAAKDARVWESVQQVVRNTRRRRVNNDA